MDFSDKRLSYEKGELLESYAPSNPFDLFKYWMNEAIELNVPEPYAMSLATCGRDNMPSVRTVLMREVTESGIIFYTNYLSDKGSDIEDNPLAECLFFWHDLQRQVRVRGTISKIDAQKSTDYFHKRPYESQIGAWVSQPQSGVVASREQLDKQFDHYKAKYPQEGEGVPKPEYWGGYELTIDEFEFWQGRPSRLHDRLLYSKASTSSAASDSQSASWEIKRLMP